MKNRQFIKEGAISAFAALLAALNLNSFIAAGNLVPGGFSGIAMLAVRVGQKFFNIELSYSVLYMLLNIPVTLLVWKTISKRFTIISLIDIVLTSLFVLVVPKFEITDDLLLICVFGGIINGVSNSLVVLSNGCSGGLDFISIYVAKKNGKSFWNQAFLINTCTICVSGFLFGWTAALYSIIYQFVSTQVVNMLDTRYKRTYLLVVTNEAKLISEAIALNFHHSVTILEGVGSYTNEKKQVLYTVCGDYETNRVIELIQKVDPRSFINVSQSQRIVGNFHEKGF